MFYLKKDPKNVKDSDQKRGKIERFQLQLQAPLLSITWNVCWLFLIMLTSLKSNPFTGMLEFAI